MCPNILKLFKKDENYLRLTFFPSVLNILKVSLKKANY